MSAELDNVLRMRLATSPSLPADQRNRTRQLGRDWAAALDAVQQASETMEAAELRSRDIEARGVALAERALAELKQSEARIQGLEAALRAAESRAAEADARAQEAEQWLARLSEAIQDRLVSRSTSYRGEAAA
jgi:chromosome segregation ATPase